MADGNDGTGSYKRKLRMALDADFKAALDDPSHDILTQVREGTLTWAEADEWASLPGRAPFTSKPAPTTYEPRQCRYWTLAQVTAWAIWRTDDAVRDVSEEYVARCVEWIEVRSPRVRFVRSDKPEPTPAQDRVGYELGSPKGRRPNDVLTSARDGVLLQGDPAPYMAPEQARREIIDALQAGDHLLARHAEGETIDRHLWDVLSPFHDGDGPHDAVFYPSGKQVRFHRVRVERDAVLKIWPHANIDASAPEEQTNNLTEYRTGMPGRPPAYHLVLAEFEARITRGEVESTVAGEARILEQWLESTHPKAAPCKAPSIENKIRKRHSELFPKGGRGQKKK